MTKLQKLQLGLGAMLCAAVSLPANAAISSYRTWAGATTRVAQPVPAKTPTGPYLGLPDAKHPRSLSATYTGPVKAQFGYTYLLPTTRNGVPSALTTTASATGVANFTARADTSGARFNGSLSKFKADPQVGTKLPKDFNQRAVRDVMAGGGLVVPVNGRIMQASVDGTLGTQVGVYAPTKFFSPQVLPRTKDYLPDRFQIKASARSPLNYTVLGISRGTDVSYDVRVVRR